jgi:hypothetical protein
VAYSDGSAAFGGRARGSRVVMRRLRVVWRLLASRSVCAGLQSGQADAPSCGIDLARESHGRAVAVLLRRRAFASF